MTNIFWRFSIICILFFVVISCKKETDEPEQAIDDPTYPEVFGFHLKDYHAVYDTIKNGDNLGKMLMPFGETPFAVHDIAEKIRDSFDLRKIKIGQPITYIVDAKNPSLLKAFVYEHNQIEYTIVDLRDSIVAIPKKKPITIRRRVIASEIKGSLFETLSKEGVDASAAQTLANVFAYSVDFFRIQKGDKFGIILNEKYINDSIYAGIDNLEASFFEYRGKKIYAFPFKIDTTARKFDYYDEEGKALKAMFLKAPLDFFRITSRYSPKRFHPVQKTWKAHQGTDYAAPHGTPIKSTAAGVVERTGFTAGNGNYVKVKHNQTYATQYLHMSKILVRQGQRVAQGETIGLVGSTGLATGPHVCYRFWKNGKQVDPLAEVMPNSQPMLERVKPRYMKHIQPLKKELDDIAQAKFK